MPETRDKFVCVDLHGGLGNQMFQYACGHAVAHHHGVPVKVNWCGDKFVHRELDLPQLVDNLQYLTAQELARLERYRFWHRKLRLYRRQMPNFVLRRFPLFREKQVFYFDRQIFTTQTPLYLDGCWQNYRYFLSTEKSIKVQFLKNIDQLSLNRQTVSQLARDNTISLHVRLTDYHQGHGAANLGGIAGREYYRAALRYLHERLSGCKVYLFSDDINAAKELVRGLAEVHVLEDFGCSHVRDLIYMSLCAHNIVANSTFSWWGAWLNTRPNAMAIAPRQWHRYNFRKFPSKTHDIVPENWILV